MAPRLFRSFLFALLAIALLGPSPSQADDKELRSTIAIPSSRDFPEPPALNQGEIYLISPDVNPDAPIPCTDPPLEPDHCDPRRLTNNEFLDVFPTLSPDGKKLVFDSNRLHLEPGAVNTADLFLMNTDGTEQTHLTRGSSATWSPDSKQVAFHASALGEGTPIRGELGPVTTDSDIFVINVDDCLEDPVTCLEENGPIKQNRTNDGGPMIDDDPDWSPDGTQIAFTRHRDGDGAPGPNQGNDNPTTEIFVMNADGTGDPIQLTDNTEEERAPAWSPDGKHIAFMCRPAGGVGPFQICVMDVDGPLNNRTWLTAKSPDPLRLNGSPTWSPDGTQIAFSRNPIATRELWWIDNMDNCLKDVALCHQPQQLTETDGINLEPNWGVVRVTGQGEGQVAADGKGKNGTADHGKQHKDKGKKDTKHKQRHGGGKRHR